MTLPRNTARQRARAITNRLASQFAKRLAKGKLLDRTAKEIGEKNPKVVRTHLGGPHV